MTNKDKYLKEGVDIEELANKILIFNAETFERERTCFNENLEKFFNAPAQPTLTEDERVILRNIKDTKSIGRSANGLYFISEQGHKFELIHNLLFGHLFQFIKERRRIFY